MSLMSRLLSGRTIVQPTQVQTTPGSVAKVDYGLYPFSRPIGYQTGVSLGVTRQILSSPMYGSLQPNSFIQVHGIPPKPPVIGQIGDIKGSNAPSGGAC